MNKIRAFTLIELLVVIAITLMITGLALSNFRRYQAQRSVEGALEITLSQITRAHLDTISSRNDTSYGAHIESDRITYFAGTTYNSSDSRNIMQILPNGTELVNLSLNGGGQDIKFKRVTGDTDQWGSFVLRSTAFPTTMKTITVNAIGTIVY